MSDAIKALSDIAPTLAQLGGGKNNIASIDRAEDERPAM
jgi:hypothetical protein